MSDKICNLPIEGAADGNGLVGALQMKFIALRIAADVDDFVQIYQIGAMAAEDPGIAPKGILQLFEGTSDELLFAGVKTLT